MTETKAGYFLCPHCGLAHGVRSVVCPRTGKGLADQGAKARGKERHGSIIDGKYRLFDELGRGRSGAVYEGVALGAGQLVAIKLLNDGLGAGATTSLQHVAETLRSIGHANICAPLDVGAFTQDRAYVVMDLLRGVPLADKLASDGVMFEEEIKSVFAQMLAGLHAAHEAGLVHGALTPNNVYLVDRPNRPALVKLLDFGGHSPGAPGYLAPEQLRGEPVTRHTDVWACGALLYEMLTGRQPFAMHDAANVKAELPARRTVPPSEVTHGLTDVWDPIVARALQANPEDRFADAHELALALPRKGGRTRLPSLHDSRTELDAPDTTSPTQRHGTKRSKANGTRPAVRVRLPALDDSLSPIESGASARLAFTGTVAAPSPPKRLLPSLHDSGSDLDVATSPAHARAKRRSDRVELAPPPDSLHGREISGKFRIEAVLGEGASGTVYHGVHRALGRDVAIKILHAQNRSDSRFVRRFRAEARVASKLDHVNITRVIDFGEETDGLLYLVMEYVDGGSLESLIATMGKLPMLRAADIAIQVCRALHVAHKRGIIHRDIKPANILLASHDEDDRGQADLVKVCDFGIAKLKQPDPDLNEVTKVGTLCGSPAYMSPEYTRGLEPDARSDVYALGITLYEALTGVVPFRDDTLLGMFAAHQVRPPEPIATLVPEIDPRLDAVVLRMLAKEPDDRFASAREVAAALSEVVAHLQRDGDADTDVRVDETFASEPALPASDSSDPLPADDSSDPLPAEISSDPLPADADSSDPLPAAADEADVFAPLTKERILAQRDGELAAFLRRVVEARSRRAVASGRLPTAAAYERSLSARWQRLLSVSALERIVSERGVEALFGAAGSRVMEREEVVAAVGALRRVGAAKRAALMDRALVLARESDLWSGSASEEAARVLGALSRELRAVDDEPLCTLLERAVRKAPEHFTLGPYED